MIGSPGRHATGGGRSRTSPWKTNGVTGAPTCGLRITTGVEYAKVDAPPDYRRIRSMLPFAQESIRDLDLTEQSIWLGRRPTLPNSVPVIGRSPRYDNVLLAFGHSHLGLTMGPATGQIIADIAAGRDPGIDLAPYRPDR